MSDFKVFLNSLPRVSEGEFYIKAQNKLVENAQGHITHLRIHDKNGIDFSEIGQLAELKHLMLSGNQLNQLPTEITTLNNLKYLCLDNNQLTQLPPEIAALNNLAGLNLSYNQLRQLPAEFANFRNLVNLGLSGKQFSQLPTVITTLKNLEHLFLENSQITQLPAEIAALKNLKAIYLNYSQLIQFPPEIAELNNLERLYLLNNQLSQLPPELTSLTKLCTFWIAGNPIATDLDDVTSSLNGIELVRYLIRVQDEQARSLMVGDERVSKTSLTNCLRRKTLNRNETMTQDIDIIQHQFDLCQLTENLITIAQLEAETAHSIAGFNEDQINDQFRKALTHKGYRVADQSRGGISQSGKSAGERDLVIRNRNTGVVECILEGLILKSYNKNIIDNHYHKLNHQYDSGGNKSNFMLVYAKAANFNNLWQKYSKHIKQMEDISKSYSDKFRIKVGRSQVGFTIVYHIFVDFHVPLNSRKNP